jgi:glycosyltransferase involved in cell wall biosynthesis
MSATQRPLRLVAYTDATEIGGAEAILGQLLGALRSDIAVAVVGVDERVVDEVVGHRPGAIGRVLPAVRDKRSAPAIVAHVRAFRALRPDIVHANLRTPWTCQYGVLAGLLAPGAGVVAVEHLPLPTTDLVQRRFKRMLSGRLAAHVAVGTRAARLVEEYAGLRAGSIRVIHNGLPDIELDPAPRAFAGPVVGSLGRLDVQKGYDVLLHALAELDGVSALLVGDGPERPRLERLAAELGVSDRVEITGWRDDARSFLASIEVFCLPSRYEGFPLSIVEAMLAGRPVVATDVGSVGEAVLDGETGLLVAPDDPGALGRALRTALEPATAARLGAAGRALARERFTLDVMVAAYEALYDSIRRALS